MRCIVMYFGAYVPLAFQREVISTTSGYKVGEGSK